MPDSVIYTHPYLHACDLPEEDKAWLRKIQDRIDEDGDLEEPEPEEENDDGDEG